ncbi:MAG: hypothetical protein RPR97_15960 [Colwellia sp.]
MAILKKLRSPEEIVALVKTNNGRIEITKKTFRKYHKHEHFCEKQLTLLKKSFAKHDIIFSDKNRLSYLFSTPIRKFNDVEELSVAAGVAFDEERAKYLNCYIKDINLFEGLELAVDLLDELKKYGNKINVKINGVVRTAVDVSSNDLSLFIDSLNGMKDDLSELKDRNISDKDFRDSYEAFNDRIRDEIPMLCFIDADVINLIIEDFELLELEGLGKLDDIDHIDQIKEELEEILSNIQVEFHCNYTSLECVEEGLENSINEKKEVTPEVRNISGSFPELVSAKGQSVCSIEVDIDALSLLDEFKYGRWEEFIQKAAANWVNENEYIGKGTLWGWGSPSVNFLHPSYSVFYAVIGMPKEFREHLEYEVKVFGKHVRENSDYVVPNSRDGWNVRCHIQDGKAWKKEDDSCWQEVINDS